MGGHASCDRCGAQELRVSEEHECDVGDIEDHAYERGREEADEEPGGRDELLAVVRNLIGVIERQESKVRAVLLRAPPAPTEDFSGCATQETLAALSRETLVGIVMQQERDCVRLSRCFYDPLDALAIVLARATIADADRESGG